MLLSLRTERESRRRSSKSPLSQERRNVETDRNRIDERAGPRPGGTVPRTAATARRGPPPPKAKGKKGAPGDELRKTYELLRRVRSDTGGGRTEERIKDWTVRATDLYRRALRTREQGDLQRTREIGTAAHDLARAVDHARNAADSTDRTRTCPLLPTAPVPKTSMTERAVTSTGPTAHSLRGGIRSGG